MQFSNEYLENFCLRRTLSFLIRHSGNFMSLGQLPPQAKSEMRACHQHTHYFGQWSDTFLVIRLASNLFQHSLRINFLSLGQLPPPPPKPNLKWRAWICLITWLIWRSFTRDTTCIMLRTITLFQNRGGSAPLPPPFWNSVPKWGGTVWRFLNKSRTRGPNDAMSPQHPRPKI